MLRVYGFFAVEDDFDHVVWCGFEFRDVQQPLGDRADAVTSKSGLSCDRCGLKVWFKL